MLFLPVIYFNFFNFCRTPCGFDRKLDQNYKHTEKTTYFKDATFTEKILDRCGC